MKTWTDWAVRAIVLCAVSNLVPALALVALPLALYCFWRAWKTLD